MDPNNSTSCSKTIKEHLVNPQQVNKRELSQMIMCRIPDFSNQHIHEKKTCKDSLVRSQKRGDELVKASSIKKSKEPSSGIIKHYLSEKVLEPKFTSGKLQQDKRQMYIALLDNNHFVNAKYSKLEKEKPTRSKISGHMRHKSNLSLSKQGVAKDDGHIKNNSMVTSLLAKNMAINKGQEDLNHNLNMTKNIVIQRKKASSSKFAKAKDSKAFVEVEKPKRVREAEPHLAFFSNNSSPMQGNFKKISIDSKNKDLMKKYFFNIQACKKRKNDSKPHSLLDNQKPIQRGFSAANFKKPNGSTKQMEKAKQPSNEKRGLLGNDDSLVDKNQLSDAKRMTAPKFTEVLRNIYRDKETKDVKNLKKVIEDYIQEHNKVPETGLQFYQVIKLLGKGSFGKVYLGLQRLTNRLVAIKCLEKAHFKDESTKRKILSEVRILKKLLGHPNVVKLLEVFENKKYVFFVTEYATNGDLLKYAKSTTLMPEKEAKYMFYQIAMGLRYIHSQNIIHRDVKLDNILIDEMNRCKICDFGVSRQIDPREIVNEQCGTPAYLAPEIIKDQGYKGFGADIWSLGVLLFCLLTGNMPFKAATIEELHQKITEGKYEFPETPKLSKEAMDLVSRMLVLDPEHRASIDEVVKHDWLRSLNFETTTIKNIKEFEKGQNNYLMEFKYEVNDFALNHVCELGFTRQIVEVSIANKDLNHASACYFNLEKDFV